MKDRIESILPSHQIVQSNANNIYIVDYKNLNKGDVKLLEDMPVSVKYVYLENKKAVDIYFDGFKDNALEISKGNYNSQCECVVFPVSCSEDDWVLFIETKYTNDIKSAFAKENDYPNCMVKQIIETVRFFREKGILSANKRATAIVSFPNLISDFNSTFFTGAQSELDILKEHKILIRATNSAIIKSPKRIALNSE